MYIDKYNRQFSYDLKGCGGLKAMYMHELEIHVTVIYRQLDYTWSYLHLTNSGRFQQVRRNHV